MHAHHPADTSRTVFKGSLGIDLDGSVEQCPARFLPAPQSQRPRLRLILARQATIEVMAL